MPAWTLRYLMSEATAMAGPDVAALEPSRVSLLVNQAIQEIALTTPMAEKESIAITSTVSGQPKMYLPADCDEVISLSWLTAATGVSFDNADVLFWTERGTAWATGFQDSGGWAIRQASPWEVDSQSEGTATGVPDRYLQFATWLELYPSPNSAYSMQLRYYNRISDLTNLDATPSIASHYHGAVRLKTAELLCERTGDTERAAYFANRYAAYMLTMPDIQKRRLRDRTGGSFRVQMRED